MIKDNFLLALKNIKNRGIRSWLTMLGIFIGIAAVVSLISLGSGLQSAITGQFASIDPDKLTITNAETGFGPPGSTAIKKLNSNDFDLLENVNGVDLVIQRIIRVVEVNYNDISKFKYIANLPEDEEQISVIYDTLNVKTIQGRLLTKNDRRKVVLGNDFLDKDDFGKEIRLGKTINIQGTDFEVIGFLDKAGTFTINSVILMSDEDMRKILDIPKDEYDILIVQVKDKDKISEVKFQIEESLRDDRNLKIGEEDFSVQTPEQGIQTINTILVIINLVIGGIAAISLLVGAIGITNTMYTSVLERTKEIGVIKAIGAKNSDVLSLFLIESALLGLAGGIIGSIIGLGLAFLVAYIVQSAFPGLNFSVSISYPLISLSILFSLMIGTIAGAFPARQASKLKPVDALRK